MIYLTVLDLLRLAKITGLIDRWYVLDGCDVTFGMGADQKEMPGATVPDVQRAIRDLPYDRVPSEVKAGAEYRFLLRLASCQFLADARAEVDLAYVRQALGRAVDAGRALAWEKHPSTEEKRRLIAERLGLHKRMGYGTMNPLHTLKAFEAMARAHDDGILGFGTSSTQLCLVLPTFLPKVIVTSSELAIFYLANSIAGAKVNVSEATLDCISELADLCPWWHLVKEGP